MGNRVSIGLALDAVLDAMPDAVFVVDGQAVFVHANRAGLDLLGRSASELLSIRMPDVLSASDAWVESEFERFKEEGFWRGRVELRRKDGSLVEVEAVGSVMQAPEGPVYPWTCRPVAGGPLQEQVSALQQTVANILAGAASLEDAAPPLLQALAQELGWDEAELWVADQTAGVVRCAGVWTSPFVDLEDFANLTMQLTLPMGSGLPGRVWRTGKVEWLADGLPERLVARTSAAREHGLNAAFAVPIPAGDEVVAVVAFFARAARKRDPELTDAIRVITVQLGQFILRLQTEQALRESRDQLEAILDGVEDGITVMAPDGRLLWANEGAARAIGYDSVEDLLAAPGTEIMARFELMDEEGAPLPTERLPGRRALRGERSPKELVGFRVVGTGEQRWAFVTASPVYDATGRVQFAISIFRDMTERRRIEERQRFLGEASAILASSLDYETTLRSVAQLAVSRLADWCVVYVQDDDGLRQLEVAHADPSRTPLVEELQRRYPFSEDRSKAIVEVARTGRPQLIPEITDEMLARSAPDEEYLEAVRGLGFVSAIVAPIRAPERILGVIVFVSSASGRRFDQADLALAEELGRRAAIAIDHARVYRERSHVARTLQESLLPPGTPAMPGLEVATRYRPALHEIAGDFYDLFPLGAGEWGVMIGDVCGKGAPAAALTALARYTVHAAAIEHRDPTTIMSVLNEALLRADLQGRFCTLLFGVLRPADGAAAVTLASGGHPLPVVLRADGAVETHGVPGTLLGALPTPRVHEETVELGPGDAIILYTDGLTDGAGLEPSTMASVLGSRTGRSAEEIADALDSMAIWSRPEPLRDDLALLVLRVPPARP
jgi:PAS domain S-box-containing protein